MNKTDWQRRSALFDEAVELPEGARDAWLVALAAREPAHVDAVRNMLVQYDRDQERARDVAQRTTTPLPATLGIAGLGAEDFVAQLDAATSPAGSSLRLQEGEQIGPWQLTRKIGEGGMGAVWLASRRDGNFEGRAAIKFLRTGLGKTEVAERFLRERRLLARLAHPNIARLLDAGTHQGEPYLVMEYIEGDAITDWAAAHAPRVADRVALVLKVCRAIEHAHGQLIVHRDLKPSNVLVNRQGEPSLLDFGIAKLIDDDDEGTALTRMTGRGYTLGYCAPEQITGEPTGVAADVFSMGVMLFELLTGSMPYKPSHEGRAALEHAIVHTDARTVSRVLAEAPATPRGRPVDAARAKGDLEAIVAKALRTRPADRYATLSALADDLERWVDNRPVLARRNKWQYTTLLWLKRNRALATVATVAFVAVGTGLVAALWQAERANDEARRADAEKETAIEERRRAEIATAQANAALGEANEQKARAASEAQRAAAEARRADQEAADAKRSAGVAADNARRATEAALSAEQSLVRANAANRRTESAKQFLTGMFDPRRFERYEPGKRGEFPVKELIAQSAQDLRSASMDAELKSELLAEASGLLGNVDDDAGSLAAARESLEIAKPLRDSSPEVYRNALLGYIAAAYDGPQRAEVTPLVDDLIATLEREGQTGGMQYARALTYRGEIIYAGKGPASNGRDDLLRASQLYEKLGNKRQQAQTLARWSIMTDLRGDSTAALDGFSRAIALYKAAGEEGSRLAQLYSRNAGALRRLERIPESIASYESALAINERVLGKAHSGTLEVKMAFGFMLTGYGQQRRGVAMINDAYELTLSQNHAPAMIARARSTLARAMVAEGDNARTMQLAKDALAYYRDNKRAIGEVSNLETMAQAALFAENYAEAIKLANEADAAAERAYGKSGIQRDVSRLVKVFVLTESDHPDALPYIDATEKLLTPTRGISSNGVLLRVHRAQVLVKRGRFDDAAAEIERVRKDAEADRTNLATMLRIAELDLARAKKQDEQVIAILRGMLPSRVKSSGADSFRTQVARLELASELVRAGRDAEARMIVAEIPASFKPALLPPLKAAALSQGLGLLPTNTR
ncbi:MAG: protein kinase [Betaproteobacteria bacterium]|nr:protein kinase [Betaproteobacteria bacterium]